MTVYREPFQRDFDCATLDFLQIPSQFIANLTPDDNGDIVIENELPIDIKIRYKIVLTLENKEDSVTLLNFYSHS